MGYRFAPPACETLRSLRTCCDDCAPGNSCGRGLMGCGCGGACDKKGFGIFEAGIDFSSWGWQEWTAVGIGAYFILSIAGDIRRGGQRVGRGAAKVKRGAQKVKRSYQVFSGGRS